ncbi:hypothetical protein LR48_Vigan07g109400 [Vigna angularis]|uniref:Ubiquitin-like protease family profile domain-containing protein n=1 Tax=Phaseolus angularis TaxID=3914 RepID=A0A0L9UX07_PHAAN|nr:hypothetical protein LR48_Vigan07g109400 [Vigna angularis]
MTSSGSGLMGGGGRFVTHMPDVTSRRVGDQKLTVEFDPRLGVPTRAHATSFRRYLGVVAKAHVSIVAKCWDDVPEGKRLAAQERQRLNDAPHLLSRGGYAKLEKKLKKSRADALGLESLDLAPAPARYMDTIVVDQGRSSMYGFVEPHTIRPSGNTLQNRQQYLQTWMDESKRDVYLVPYIDGKMKNDLRTMLQGVIGKSRGQLVQILYPKCNQQLDSWECGFYVMCWIKPIIRAVIIDDWNECFKSTSPIQEDTIRQIRQEWTAYLLQRWS